MNATVGLPRSKCLGWMAASMGMLSGAISSGGRSLIRLVTTIGILGGVGVGGAGLYGQQLQTDNEQVQGAQAFIKDHAALLIGVGMALIVLGAILQFFMMRRMRKQMMGGMGMPGAMGGRMGAGMGGMPGGAGAGGMGGAAGGMPDMSQFMAMQGAAAVKVRCPNCKSLEAEGAAFCSKCGKPMQ